jgi:hypothetical protein
LLTGFEAASERLKSVFAKSIVLQDLDFLARRADFLVGQAIRLSPPAVAGVWLRLRCSVGQNFLPPETFPPGTVYRSSGRPKAVS